MKKLYGFDQEEDEYPEVDIAEGLNKTNLCKKDLKDFKEKLPIDEMQWKAILHEKGLAGVFEFAMKKYGNVSSWRNRTHDSAKRYEAAQLRHYRKRKLGEIYDKESGLPHLAHEVWCVLTQLEFLLDDLDSETGIPPIARV